VKNGLFLPLEAWVHWQALRLSNDIDDSSRVIIIAHSQWVPVWWRKKKPIQSKLLTSGHVPLPWEMMSELPLVISAQIARLTPPLQYNFKCKGKERNGRTWNDLHVVSDFLIFSYYKIEGPVNFIAAHTGGWEREKGKRCINTMSKHIPCIAVVVQRCIQLPKKRLVFHYG
jgi:hypothetical protein